MSIRTFWTILLKILGLFLVLSSLVVVPSFFGTFMLGIFSDFSGNTSPLLSSAIILFLVIAIYAAVLWLFVFKTDWLIDKLRLDKGFAEDRIDLNVKGETVLRVAVIVIGGLVLVEALPELCKQVFVFVRERNMSYANPTSGWIVLQSVKSAIGALLMVYNKPIVKWIGRFSRQE